MYARIVEAKKKPSVIVPTIDEALKFELDRFLERDCKLFYQGNRRNSTKFPNFLSHSNTFLATDHVETCPLKGSNIYHWIQFRWGKDMNIKRRAKRPLLLALVLLANENLFCKRTKLKGFWDKYQIIKWWLCYFDNGRKYFLSCLLVDHMDEGGNVKDIRRPKRRIWHFWNTTFQTFP